MGLEAFTTGQYRGDLAQVGRTFGGAHDQAGAFLEIIDPQRRTETCGTRGRQYVVRTSTVVAHRLGGIAPHEYCPGMADLRRHRQRVFHRQFQMLRCDVVADRDRLIHIAYLDQGTTQAQRGLDNRFARHLRQQVVDTLRHLFDELGIGTEQDGLGILVVFGLGEQIHGNPVRVGLAITDHQDLGGPCDHVDAHGTEYQPLGRRHEDIARTNDLVHLGDGLGAIGQRCNRLSPANGKDPIHADHRCGGQHQFIDLTIRGGHHHDQFLHPGDLGRDRIHQYRGGIGGLATGNIQASTIQRGNLLPQQGAIGLSVGPGFLLLVLVIHPYPFGGTFQGLTLGRRDRLQGLLQTFLGDLQLRHAADRHAVKAIGVFDHRGITTLTYGGEDLAHDGVDLVIGNAFPGQQFVQFGPEVVAVTVQSLDLSHGHVFPLISLKSISPQRTQRINQATECTEGSTIIKHSWCWSGAVRLSRDCGSTWKHLCDLCVLCG